MGVIMMGFVGKVKQFRENLKLMRMMRKKGVHPVALRNMEVYYSQEKDLTDSDSQAS